MTTTTTTTTSDPFAVRALVRVKIPPVDVALLGASATVLATTALRSAIDLSALARGPQPLLAAVFATALVAPLAFVAYLLWKSSELRATNWRRAAAKVASVTLGALAFTTSLGGVLELPAPLALSWRTSAAVIVALLALAAAVYATSPARQMPRPPKKR
jgi:hypothetical protein